MKNISLLVISFVFFISSYIYAEPEVKEFPRRNAVVAAIEKVSDTVVNISTEKIVQRRLLPFGGMRDEFFDEFFRDFYQRNAPVRKYKTHSLGSGVIFDPEGYILTNEHVISKASKIHVKLSDGKQYEAKVVSTDPEYDLAVLKIDAPKKLHAIIMEETNSLLIGETVIALGNPFGLENSVTVGVLSARNRKIMDKKGDVAYEGLIQTDASINPGNSGGPLININGKLLGINTAIYAEAQGIGFAIPIDKLEERIKYLLDYKVFRKIWIGIDVEYSPKNKAMLIKKVYPDTSASKAKLEVGDLIKSIDGSKIEDCFTFNLKMMNAKVNDTVKLNVERQGVPKVLGLTVLKTPKPDGQKLVKMKMGIMAQELNEDLAKALNINLAEGVVVSGTEEKSPAAKLGLKEGDVLLALGNVKIKSLDDLGQILENVVAGTRMRIVIYREKVIYYAEIVTK